MVSKVEVYKCEECGFHYEMEEVAKDCEKFCIESHACNLEIIKNAIESK